MSRRPSGAAAVVALVVLLVSPGCGSDGGDGSPGAAGSTPACPEAAVERVALPGFGEIAIRLTSPTGQVTDGCALLADDEPARAQGLMGQQDLRGYDAMLFRYPAPSSTRFYMRNTLVPLTVAFFASDGRFVSAIDMSPCPPETVDCPRYGASAPYQFALEVLAGDLGTLGGGPGSVLSFPAPDR